MSQWAKSESPATTIFGGVHPTLAPEEVLRQPSVDIVCRGEGEYPMLFLAELLDAGREIRGIPSMGIKQKSGEIEMNAIGPLIDDLDSLPHPDRELFNISEVIRHNGYRFEILSGRGCPFSCTYCCNHALRRISGAGRKFVRKRSVDNLLEEIRELKSRYRMDSILFHDETFTLDRRWCFEFCERYGREYHIPFHCLARVETIDDELAGALKQAGCHAISLGVESGSERIRRDILKKNISDAQILDAFHILRSHGIKRFSFNMIGLPEETPEEIEKTIQLNRVIDPDWMGVIVFTPYPGTELHTLCRERGYLLSQEFQPNYLTEKGFSLNLPTITRRELVQKYRKFQSMAYGKYVKENYPWLNPLFKIFAKPLLRSPLHDIISRLGYRLLYKA